jgi:hypothetical protein
VRFLRGETLLPLIATSKDTGLLTKALVEGDKANTREGPGKVMEVTAKKKVQEVRKARKAKPVVRKATGKVANTIDKSKLTKTENANKASCMESGIQNSLEKCEKKSKINAKEAKPKNY